MTDRSSLLHTQSDRAYNRGVETKTVSVRFDLDTLARLEARATAERRNLSQLVRILIEDALAEREKLPPT